MLKFAVGSALLVTATHCVALSLGGTQGNVIIGRPLDVLVQSSITAAEAASGLCLEAEVIYGDARVPATAVTVAIHRTGLDGTGALRVRASEPVNEPIVTLMLKAGCQQHFRRTYSLLADIEPASVASRTGTPVAGRNTFEPREIPLAPAPSAPSGAPVVPGVVSMTGSARAQPSLPVPAPARTGVQSTTTQSSGDVNAANDVLALTPETPIRLSAPAPRPMGVASVRSKARPLLPAVPAQAVATSAPATVAPPVRAEVPAASGPRLKLDPVELPPSVGAANAPVTPEVGGVAASGGVGTPDASAPAVATPTPAEEALQQELQALRVEQERMRLAMETLNAQLARAEEVKGQRGEGGAWFYALGAAVIALLGALVVLWRRRRPIAELPDVPVNAPWWESSTSADPSTAAGSSSAVEKTHLESSLPVPAEPTANQWASSSQLDGLEINEAGESLFREVPVSPLHFNALMDAWQRVDFFESIGQHGDAMEVLKGFVSEHPRASEAPYLRWVAIAKVYGNDSDQSTAVAFYEHHFQRLLSPNADTRSLEDDLAFLQQLVRAWPELPSREMLQVALASQPGDPSNLLTIRSTEAFDDLIMLLGVDELLGSSEMPVPSAPPTSFVPTMVIPPPQVESAESPEIDFPEWTTVDNIREPKDPSDSSSGVDTPVPPAVSPPGTQATEEPMLDFELPDLMPASPSATPAHAQESIAKGGDPGLPAANLMPNPKELKPLDFDLFDLEPKVEKKTDPKA